MGFWEKKNSDNCTQIVYTFECFNSICDAIKQNESELEKYDFFWGGAFFIRILFRL